MHHLHILSPQTPSPTLQLCLVNHERPEIFSSSPLVPVLHNSKNSFHGKFATPRLPRRRSSKCKWRILAVDRESQYEVDQDKARQALDKLDQQLESLSTRQVNPPKIKASSLSDMKEDIKFQSADVSGSSLTVTAFALFLFSLFYNILFLTVIKPSIDMPDDIAYQEDIVATNVITSKAPTEILQNK